MLLKNILSISNLDIKNIVFDDVINILDDTLQKDDIEIEELNNVTDYKKKVDYLCVKEQINALYFEENEYYSAAMDIVKNG